jgi:hypothetical protein
MPIIDRLIEAIKDKLVNGKLLPKSKFKEALGYFFGLMPHLKNYTQHTWARLDNNVAEPGESRHSLARNVFHGRRGELRQRYREGQEDQLGTLGLVVNVIILWNTIYMDAILNQLKQEGLKVLDDDVAARLSPLIHDHINMLGRYSIRRF